MLFSPTSVAFFFSCFNREVKNSVFPKKKKPTQEWRTHKQRTRYSQCSSLPLPARVLGVVVYVRFDAIVVFGCCSVLCSLFFPMLVRCVRFSIITIIVICVCRRFSNAESLLLWKAELFSFFFIVDSDSLPRRVHSQLSCTTIPFSRYPSIPPCPFVFLLLPCFFFLCVCVCFCV
jgi:hypothetical protein